MNSLLLLGSPEDFSLVSKDFAELCLDINYCLNRDEVLQIIEQECKKSNRPVTVGYCGSFKDFLFILHRKEVTEHIVGIILCNTFENRKTLALLMSASPWSDFGEFALELVYKTFEQVEHIKDILRNCEPLIAKRQQYFQHTNQKVLAKNKLFKRNVGFPRKILKKWNRFKFWIDFFSNKVLRNLTKKIFWL